MAMKTKKASVPAPKSETAYLTKPLSELRGLDYTRRVYFEWGVKDAREGKPYRMGTRGKDIKKSFVGCYDLGFTRTEEVMKNKDN